MEPHWNNARNTLANDDDDYLARSPNLPKGLYIFVNVLVNNDERTTVPEARHSGLPPVVIRRPAFFHRANAFPSTTTSSSAKYGRLVWFVVSKSHFYKQRTRSDIADVNTDGGRPTSSQWWLVLIYDHQNGYFKDWNKTDFRLTSSHVNHFVSFEVAAILHTAVKTASRVVGETT